MAKQGVVLKHEAHPALARRGVGGVFVVQADGAAIRHFEAGDDPQERGFAGTGRPQQRHQLAALDAEADVLQRLEAPIGLADVRRLDAHLLSCPVFHSRNFLRPRAITATTLSKDATAKAPA